MKKTILALALALLLLTQIGAAYAQTPDDYFNMLLMVTEDEGEPVPEGATGSRAGALVVLALDKTDCQMRLLSVNGQLAKGEDAPTLADINALFGPDHTRESLNDLLGLSVPYYALITPDAMQKIVDSLGGIEIEVLETDLSITLPNGKPAFEAAGLQLIGGAQTRAYLNVGAGNSQDPEEIRAERKQKALSQMMKRALSGGKGRLIAFGVTAMTNMDTNVGLGDLIPLAEAMMGASPGAPQMSKSPLTAAEATPEGALLKDAKAEAQAVKAFLYPDLEIH